MFEQKLDELTNDENFECLTNDPSKSIQKEAKSLLKMLLPDTNIPEHYWIVLIPNNHGQRIY